MLYRVRITEKNSEKTLFQAAFSKTFFEYSNCWTFARVWSVLDTAISFNRIRTRIMHYILRWHRHWGRSSENIYIYINMLDTSAYNWTIAHCMPVQQAAVVRQSLLLSDDLTHRSNDDLLNCSTHTHTQLIILWLSFYWLKRIGCTMFTDRAFWDILKFLNEEINKENSMNAPES